MRKNKRERKKQISENCCFVCKEGGSLILCDHKDCLKSYHPHCVGKDADSRDNWKCDWHICCICKKAAKFHCFCCPTAICGRCIVDTEFVVARGVKGFCPNCLRLALLWEEKKDVGSNGIDFTRRETIEGLFIEYWEIIKEKEGLKLEHLQRAQILLMNGKNYKQLEDANDFSTNDLDSLDLTDCEEEDYNPSKTVRRRSKSSKKAVKGNTLKFAGWGSKALIDFLVSINEDTSVELSQYDVANIVTRYVDRKNLFDQQRKKMIVCDQSLQALLGKKMVNKNRLYSLLETHFASNIDKSEKDHDSNSEEKDDKGLTPCKRKKIRNPDVTSNCEKVMSRGSMAAVVPENLRLVYLKKSLVEELLKDRETFETKVVGSFVRVKSDPHDYKQKNSHQLVQVTVVKNRPINGLDTTALLQVSNMPIDVDMQMLSDIDFTKEEFEQLSVQMKDGLHKKPTVVELECKARILHEDITKHWITKELALLKNLIDKANEKGWKRELGNYSERRRLLLEPSEQSRLIEEIPQVIVEEVELNANSAHDKERRNLGTDPPCCESMDEGVTVDSGDINAVTKSGSDDNVEKTEIIEAMAEENDTDTAGDSVDNGDINAVTKSGSDDNVEKMEIIEVMAEKNDTAAVKPEDHDMTTLPEKDQKALVDEISLPVTAQHKQEGIEIIDLDDEDEDEDDEKGEKMKVGTPSRAKTEPTEWYCMGPLGDVRGPYEMAFLRTWKQLSGEHSLKFKVWKIGQCSADAIPLPEACG